jgi:hypothetical protein
MTRIRIERVLPAPGEILVRMGESVEPAQKIARIPAPGEIRILNVARALGLDGNDLSRVMVKKRDDRVKAGEIIATRRGLLPLWHKPCRSPMTGRLAAIGYGWVVIEAEGYPGSPIEREEKPIDGKTTGPEELDLLACVTGKVVAVSDHHSVTIETVGATIHGACGVGGETHGVLQVLAPHPSHTLTADEIGLGSNNAILVGGAGVSSEALERARQMQVRGIIVGGIPASLHDLIPGLTFPVVATEGYGNLPMSPLSFDILKRLEGHEAFINGEAGYTRDCARPIIVVPQAERQEDEGEFPVDRSPAEPARVADRVRAVRQPLLGQMGRIVSLAVEPRPVPSGFSLPGAQVAFGDPELLASQLGDAEEAEIDSTYPSGTSHPSGTSQFVPWLNLERIGGGAAS